MNSTGHSRTTRNGNRSADIAQTLKPNRLAMALMATWGALPASAMANDITLHQRPGGGNDTATTITPRAGNPNVTDIKTTTVRGNTGFNSFGNFTVDTGNTVNLYVPTGASNLVNLVNLSAPTINGTLNGLLESSGRIGGNIFFASSHGFVVGSTGVINVGSLLVTTPSAGKMDELLDFARGSGAAGSDQLVLDLLAGKYDGGDGQLKIDGLVDSAGRVDLFAASAVVAGQVNAGSRVFDAVVNNDGSLNVSAAVRKDGAVQIVGDTTVEVSGALRAMMEDQSGAVVQVAAGKSIELKGNAVVDARGGAGLDGGDVTLEAPSIRLSDNAQVLTRASGAGSAGDITLNAYSDVSCSFCVDEADAAGAAQGATSIEDLADKLSTQASPLLQAKLGKAEVVIAENARLDAGHDTDGTRAGDVSVQAFGFDRQMAGYAEATADVDVAGTIIGRDIGLRASSNALVSASILGNLLNTGDLASDVSNLVGNLGEEAAWAQIFSTLQESVDYQRVSDLGLLGLDPANYSELTVLLPYLSVLIGRAESDVTIRSTALLDASRNLDLQADTTRTVQASTFSLPIVNKKMPFNFGLAYGRIDGHSKVDVQAGAQLDAGADLDVKALSNDTLEVTATSVNNHDANGNTATTMGLAFSMAHSDISTEATIHDGALLDVDGDVAVTALTEQDLSNSAEFKAIGDGATGGPAIALTLFNSKTRAVFDADLSGAADLDVSASNLVHGQSNSASVQVGKNALDHLKKQVMNSQQIKGVTDAIANKVKSLFGMKPSADEKTPTDSKFRLASALAIGISDHQAEAVVGSGTTAPAIDIAGNLGVTALQRQESMHNSADSTVNADAEKEDGSKVSISVAAAYDQINQQTRALVGDGSSLTAARIGVGARNEQLLDLGGIDRWSSMSDIFGNLKTIATGLPEIPGTLSTSYANSTSESQDFGLAGSFAVSYHALDATAWVGDGVSLTATADDGGAWSSKPLLGLTPFYDDQGQPDEDREELRNLQWDWDAPLAVQADTVVEQLSIAGNLWWTLFNVGADGDDGKAVGGGVNVQVATNRSIAGIGADGTVEAEKVDVSAHQDELVIGISPSAGKGTSAAGNGAVVVGVVDADVNASINQSTVVDAGQVGVSATHDIGLWSAAGALAVSQETSIGIGAAVNVLTSDVQALVGDNNATDSDGDNRWRPAALGAGAAGGGNANWNVDEMLVDAKSSGQSGAFGVAGALARSEQEQQAQDQATAQDGGGDKGATDLLSGEGALLLAKFALGQAGFYDGLATAIDYGSKIKDALTETPDKAAGQLEGGKAAQKPENQIAGAGSASINVSGQNTRATVSGITIDPRGTGVGSDVTVLALNQTNQFSGAGAGALTLASGPKSDRSSAVAGAIAYNHLFNETEALVDGVTFNDSDALTVQAASAGDQIALGLGLAVSTGGTNNTAVGFSASGGAITNTTRAAVVDSEVNSRADAGSTQSVEVSAYDRARVLLGGGAFAGTSGGGTSAGGSLVIGYLGNHLQAEWLGSQAHGFDQFGVGAFSATRVLAGAIAGAVSVGSDSTAGAGSMFVLIVDNEVTAKVDRSTDTDHSVLDGGNAEVLARSVSGMGALDAQFDSASTTALSSSGLDLDGSSTVAGIEVEQSTDDSLFGGADDTSTNHSLFDGVPAGEAILGIAGSLSLSNGKAVGVSAGGIYTGSDYAASVANTDVTLGGDLDVHALNSTEALAAAVSGALGNGDSATSGSITAIVARGTVTSTVDMTGRAQLEAEDLRVTATKGGGAYSLAGNITGSAGSRSMGGAFSVNDLEQGTRAEIKGGSYDLSGDASIGAAQQSHVITAALSGSVSLSSLAIGGAGTFNRVADTTTAALSGATLDARGTWIATL
ncbi:MAG: leukotoxin LktA family filamentous adhesin, partial [Pseudoxanthomonas sp.]|nr:leukotoxin LktA family filamentous adhesin [Pseudoxanthomonas sp.]